MKKTWRKYIVAMILALSSVIVAFIFGYKEYTRRLPDTSGLKAAFKLKAVDMISQFETDELKATEHYSDKVISVEGIIKAVHITDSGGTVFLGNEETASSVMCQFDQKDLNELVELKNTRPVTIKGVCSGYLMDVVMIRCIVEK